MIPNYHFWWIRAVVIRKLQWCFWIYPVMAPGYKAQQPPLVGGCPVLEPDASSRHVGKLSMPQVPTCSSFKKDSSEAPKSRKGATDWATASMVFCDFFGFTSTLATFFFADVTWQDCSLPPWLVNPTHFCLIFCLSFCCFLIGDSLLLVAVKLITRFQKQDQWRLNNFRLYVISTKTIGSNICVDIHVRIYVLNTSKYI